MYSINADQDLIPLTEEEYKLESDLQYLVARHPALLAGEQMDATAPRRFLLAISETGIPVSESSGNVFALDLLFLDQDAVLTLVEVKRSSDTRLRREVIGQLLEYAANVCAFWTADKVRADFERSVGDDCQDKLEQTLGIEQSGYEAYWTSLKSNLERQRLRLVIVADKIPIGTLRIIEYLNRQMATTDVFAVTVARYSGSGGAVRTLVPRLLNPSLSAAQRKSSLTTQTRWTRERFYDALTVSENSAAGAVFRTIDEWATGKPHVESDLGSGASSGSIILIFKSSPTSKGYRTGRDVVFLTLWTSGTIEIEFQYLANYGAFRRDEKRYELLERMNAIGCGISPDKLVKRPNVPWSVFAAPAKCDELLTTLDWVVHELRVD